MDSQYSNVLSSIRPINTDESSSLSSNLNEEEYTHQTGTAIFSSNHSNGAENFDEDDEEEEITPAELIEKLQQVFVELLEHKTPVVECIIEQIKHMENNIRSAKKGDFRIAIHKLEIEQFVSSILEEDLRRHSNIRSKLSAEEFAYASEYLKNVRAHLTASVLEHLPSNLQDLNEAVTMPRPDIDKFVFLKAMDNIKGILIDDIANDGRNEIIDMDKGDLYIMRYNPVKSYVNSGEIQLI